MKKKSILMGMLFITICMFIGCGTKKEDVTKTEVTARPTESPLNLIIGEKIENSTILDADLIPKDTKIDKEYLKEIKSIVEGTGKYKELHKKIIEITRDKTKDEYSDLYGQKSVYLSYMPLLCWSDGICYNGPSLVLLSKDFKGIVDVRLTESEDGTFYYSSSGNLDKRWKKTLLSDRNKESMRVGTSYSQFILKENDESILLSGDKYIEGKQGVKFGKGYGKRLKETGIGVSIKKLTKHMKKLQL